MSVEPPKYGNRIKVGTALKKDIYDKLKSRAELEKRPIQEVLEDAINHFVSEPSPEIQRRMAALQSLWDNPIKVSDELFDEILNLDYYDQ